MVSLILLAFAIGYLGIIFEGIIKVNKTITALLTGTVCWIIYAAMGERNGDDIFAVLTEHFGVICSLLIFLLGAMTIVELIDLHKGFAVITHRIRTNDVGKLLWIIGLVTFFLSAMLDNLATTIIMITLLRKLLPKGEPRMILVGIVIIAANAGGAWSPIGDVTTTLLWINGQVSALGIMSTLILPSLACILVPMMIASIRMKGTTKIHGQFSMADAIRDEKMRGSLRILLGGIGSLLLVPVLKSTLGLPPFIGVLFGLGLLAVLSETIHWKKSEEDRRVYSVSHALSKVDVSSILYFMGILLLVYALEEVHVLVDFATFMDATVGNKDLVVIAIGFLSSIVDNGSLVAATQGMYSLADFPMDSKLWEFIAYCAGTGGSMLVIGSAAGVASMNMEGITFGWYLKKISILAFCGYVAGIVVYLLQYQLLHP
jgi:Na+/H+ antiporter NhaD/arsenite permease-like protein